jgi:hypothetical protein
VAQCSRRASTVPVEYQILHGVLGANTSLTACSMSAKQLLDISDGNRNIKVLYDKGHYHIYEHSRVPTDQRPFLPGQLGGLPHLIEALP